MEDNKDLTYTLTLSDGTEIAGAKRNGSAYILEDTNLTMDVFSDNTKTVIIEASDSTKEFLEDVDAIEAAGFPDALAVTFAPIPTQEIRFRQIEANQEYIAMMADIDL